MIRVRTLGEAVIEIGSATVTPAARARFGLMLYCTAQRGHRLPRHTITELLWPGIPERGARHCLRHAIYRLREMGVPFADGRIDDAVTLPTSDVELDYETILAQPSHGIGEIGEFLPGYDPSFSLAFADWVDRLRGVVHRRIRDAVLHAITAARGESRWSDVERYARLCLRFDALNEEATLALAEATALSGSKVSAVAIIDQYVADLDDGPRELRVPAGLLRQRIADRMPSVPAGTPVGDACFVGRDETMRALARCIEKARGGSGGGWLLLGEAGIGKSRVSLELTRAATLRGFVALRVACQRSDTRRPLSAFADMVPALKGLPGALGCAPGSYQFLDRLTQHAPGTASESGGGKAGGGSLLDRDEWDAAFLYASVRRAVFDLIDAVSEEQPLLLIIEDVHWLDRVSAEVARELVERSESRPLFLVLTSRHVPPRDSPLAGLVHGLTLHQLAPLDRPASERLFLALVGEHAAALAPEALKRFIALADGNPFFLRELATHWIDHGDTEAIPNSLGVAVGERLDKLDALPMRVLQACALIGKHSTLARLEQVLQVEQVGLLDALEALDRGGLLGSDGEHVLCRHDLLSDAALAQLSQSATRFLHHRIGAVLELELSGTEFGSLLWDCTEHLQLAGEVDRALALVRRYVDHVQGIGLPTEAVDIWDRALKICRTDEQRLQVTENLVVALMAAENWTRALETIGDLRQLRRALSQAVKRHDVIELAELEARWLVGDDISALLAVVETCLMDETADPAHRGQAGIWALVHAYNLADLAASTSIYSKLRCLFEQSALPPEDRATIDLIYHTGVGDLNEAVSAGRDLVKLARKTNGSRYLARALRRAAMPLRVKGSFEEAKALYLESLALGERLHLHAGLNAAAFSLGEIAVNTGNLKDARYWLSKCIHSDKVFPDDVNTAILAGQIAILGGDASQRESILERIAELPPQLASARVRSNTLAIKLGFDLLDGRADAGQETLAEFASVFKKARMMSGQDFPALIFFRMLHAQGKLDEAASEMRSYLKLQCRRPVLPYFLAPYREDAPTIVRAA